MIHPFRRRALPTVALAAAVIAATTALALFALPVGKTLAAVPQKPASRAVTLRTHQGGFKIHARGTRHGSSRWCVDLHLAHGSDLFYPNRSCAPLAGSATSIAFACPYGMGASGFYRGDGRVELRLRSHKTVAVAQRRVRDSRATGVFYAFAVRTQDLPAYLVWRSATGRRSIIATLDRLTRICPTTNPPA
jgi:hypothetical protein